MKNTSTPIKIKCNRCGKGIITVPVTGMLDRPSYKKYGKICSGCLTEEEKSALADEQIKENFRAARRYRIVRRIQWGSEELTEAEERILRFIATKIFYTKMLPTLADIGREFQGIECETHLNSLEFKKFIQPLF